MTNNQFNDWFSETHGGTGKPSWELEDDVDDLDTPDYINEYED